MLTVTLVSVQWYWLLSMGDCRINCGGGVVSIKKRNSQIYANEKQKSYFKRRNIGCILQYCMYKYHKCTVVILIVLMHHILWERLKTRVPQFFLNQHPKIIKISFIHGIIDQSTCWHLHFPFVSQAKLFLCSYSSKPAAFQCTQSPSVPFCKVEPSARSQINHVTQWFHCNLHAIVTLCSSWTRPARSSGSVTAGVWSELSHPQIWGR